MDKDIQPKIDTSKWTREQWQAFEAKLHDTISKIEVVIGSNSKKKA